MEFRILGPLEVRDGERAVPLGAAKQRALLAVLLLHANEVVAVTRLVDELWGEAPPATAEKLVQGYVYALRKRLGEDVLLTRTPGYEARVEQAVLDLFEFQRLTEQARSTDPDRAVELRRRALALWRGPPLADVLLEGPARHELGRMNELRLTTQIAQFEAELELGRHAGVVGDLESLVAAHPYDERLHGLLMLALYRSGRQAEALQAYQSVRRLLSDELGLQPGEELRRLEAAILRHDEDVLRAGMAPVAPAPTEPPTTAAASDDELRPVTVLFADIVGSIGLGECLAPDEVKALVGECVTQMSQAVQEYGGAVQAYEGDGICAYFGVPHAHEDDPTPSGPVITGTYEVDGLSSTGIFADARGSGHLKVSVATSTATLSGKLKLAGSDGD